MKISKKKVFRTVLVLMVLLAFIMLISWGVGYIKRITSSGSPVISAIPTSAAVILEINKPFEVKDKLENRTAFWKDLTQIQPFSSLKKDIHYVDSLIRLNNTATGIFEAAPLFISLHPEENTYGNFLFLIEVTANRKISYIENILKNLYDSQITVAQTDFRGESLLTANISDKGTSIIFGLYRGVLMASKSKVLVEEAILRLKTQSPFEQQESFVKTAATLGKKVDGNVYINYDNLHRLLLPLVSEKYKDYITFLRSFAHWSGLDINIKNDALILNGFTEAPQLENSYLHLFSGQTPQKMELLQLLPYNTSAFIFWGFSNYKTFNKLLEEQLQNNNNIDKYSHSLENFSSAYGLDFESFVIENISGEIAYASVGNTQNDTETHYLLCRFDDIGLLKEMLRRVHMQSIETIGIKPDLYAYREFEFSMFNSPDIFNHILGTNFDLTLLTTSCIIDNYLVLGESRNALIHIINATLFKRNLANNVQYNNFSNLLSSKANIHVYFNIAQSLAPLKNYLNADLSLKIDPFKDYLKHFDGLALQISKNNGKFYNNICLRHISEPIADETFSLWETELDYPAADILCRTINHNDNSIEIIINDKNHNLYLIDKNGLIVWKKEVGEPILGDVIQIDFYKNGKLQYLFNTANSIFLIDRNGNNVANYPLRLPQKATNSIAVFDYDNNKDYRMFLATEKNEIINLDKEAKFVKGWNNFKTKSTVRKQVQFIRLLGKDYLFVTDDTGNFYILDRRGNIRIKADKPFQVSENNIFYPLITPDRKGKFVTTTNEGKIMSIDFNGKTEEISIDAFSDKHYFIFEDINNNSLKEYTYIDSNKVFFYDYAKVPLKTLDLCDKAAASPRYFKDNAKYRIGIYTEKTNKLYLIGNDFNITENFPINGSSPFIVIDSKSDGKSYIIAANEKIVFKYFLE